MATLVLGAAGAAIGGSIGGAILGVSAATIGGFIGSTIGSVVDSWIISSLAPTQRIEGGAARHAAHYLGHRGGAVIPRLYGRMRMGGKHHLGHRFPRGDEDHHAGRRQGRRGRQGQDHRVSLLRLPSPWRSARARSPVSAASGPTASRWTSPGVTWRWYPGDEAQAADPFIAVKMGAANTPAYRGTAYVVFEELPCPPYGNRLPQLSFEVFRPLADPDTAEGLTRAVTMIPASGEFTYATQAIRKDRRRRGRCPRT